MEPPVSQRRPRSPGARSPEPGARLHGAILHWGRRRGWDPDLAEEVAQCTVEDSLRLHLDLSQPPVPALFQKARGHARKILAERLSALGDRVNTVAE